MGFVSSQIPSHGNVNRVPRLPLRLLLLATAAVNWWPALASEVEAGLKPVQQLRYTTTSSPKIIMTRNKPRSQRRSSVKSTRPLRGPGNRSSV